jgi:3-isopropylmalate/(R)-2-methylmalate dehydratase small subunit
MKIRGTAHRVGDDINTDYIINSKAKSMAPDLAELAKHTFEEIHPGMAERIKPGDVVVAGSNFGCGSSREGAVHVLRELGVSAVIASSFARIYFRNGINYGLPLIECDTTGIEQDDDVEVDLVGGVVINHTKDSKLPIAVLPDVMVAMLAAGGMKPYLALHGDLVLPPATG